MPMVPFQLDVEIRAPLAGGDIPTLDAVLLGEIVRTDPDAPDYAAGPDAAMKALKPLLKIAEGGIPQASALLFDARGGFGETVKIARRRRELWEIGRLGPMSVKKRNGVFAPRPTDRKYGNSPVNHIPWRAVAHARFLGVGDVAEIRRALSFWQGIGAQWRNGWGELTGGEGEGWEITEFPANGDREKWWGLVDENRAPVRPLPVGLFRKLGGDGKFPVRYRRVVPPYWRDSAPRVAAVVPDAGNGRNPRPPSGEKGEVPATNSVDFLLNRFARRMRPEDELRAEEKTGGKMAALWAAIKPNYVNQSGKGDTRLDGCPSLFIAAGPRAQLFSNAVPKGKSDGAFESFPSLKRGGAEWQKAVYDAAMTEVDGLCAVIEFPHQKFIAPEDIHVFSGRSDSAALSGDNGGWFSRAAVRGVEEIANRANLSLAKLEALRMVEKVRRNCDASAPKAAKWAANERKRRKLSEAESPDLRELADAWMEREREKMKLTKAEMFDLRDRLDDMGPAGRAVLGCSPRFRKKEGGE